MVHSLRSFLLAGGLVASLAAQAVAAPDLRTRVSPIKSFSSTLTAKKVNTDELMKIRKDYANSYKVKSSRITYAYPDHIKVAGKVGPIPIIYVINGNLKESKYGPIRRKKNVTNDPGQKQGLLDFGILTADQLNDYTWKYLRQEKVNGAPLEVYELRFKNIKEDPSRRVIWVDPIHKVVVRRQTFKQYHDNDLKMDMRFEAIKQVSPGVWVPTIVKVYNDEGKLGALSQHSNISVNRTIPLSDFKV